MRRCLKALKLLVEKKVAEVEGNNLKAWEYQGMIKHHIEKCHTEDFCPAPLQKEGHS